jgi:hypothetical protein
MSFMMHCLPIALVRTAKERAPRLETGAEVREDHENAFTLAISISDAVSLVTQEHWGAGHRVIREAVTESSSLRIA